MPEKEKSGFVDYSKLLTKSNQHSLAEKLKQEGFKPLTEIDAIFLNIPPYLVPSQFTELRLIDKAKLYPECEPGKTFVVYKK